MSKEAPLLTVPKPEAFGLMSPRSIAKPAVASPKTQAQPAAVYSTNVVVDTSLGNAVTGVLPADDAGVVTVPAAAGKQVGSNLFYSFSAFSLGTGGLIDFAPDGGAVNNILARVTGGPSMIDGTLGCSLPGANLFLMNPAGVVFGPNSMLNLQNSFAVTTAQQIQLGKGSTFAAVPGASDATLTTAPPSAFNFLTPNPAGVTVDGGAVSVTSGSSILVASGSLTIDAAGLLFAPDGQVGVVTVASSGTAPFDPTTLLPSPPVAATRGPVTLLNDSVISASGDGGFIQIECGDLKVSGGSAIQAETLGEVVGRGITIDAKGMVSVTGADSAGNDSVISAEVATGADGAGGTISIRAAALSLLDGGFISTISNGTGSSGNVNATIAGQVLISGSDANGNDSGIIASAQSDSDGGASGSISVTAGSVQLSAGGGIVSLVSGMGRGGNITINVSGAMIISGADAFGDDSIINTSTQSAAVGDAGLISITADSLQLIGGAAIASESFGSGKGGQINLTIAGQASLNGAAAAGNNSGIFANANSTGNAGSIALSAGSLQITGGSAISSSCSATGNGGSIDISVSGDAMLSGANAMSFHSSGLLTTALSTGAGGNAGSISLKSGTLEVLDGAQISSSTLGLGRSGDINIDVGGGFTLSGTDGSHNHSGILANSKSTGAGGDAGSISVTAGSLQILGGAGVSSSTAGLGNGGSITLNVSGPVLISGADPTSKIDSGVFSNPISTGPGGDAGAITLAASDLTLTGGAEIASTTSGGGKSGVININVSGSVTLSGSDAAGHDSAITTVSQLAGDGGDAGSVNVNAGDLSLLAGGEISSATFGRGNGGSVTVKASGQVTISGADSALAHASGIFASTVADGNAGSVSITASSLQVLNGAQIGSSTAGLGKGGDIVVQISAAAEISGADANDNDSSIVANSTATGRSGDAGAITVTTGSLQVLGGGLVNSSTAGAGRGGTVTVKASGPVTLSGADSANDDSAIVARTRSAAAGGDAGTITLSCNNLQILGGAQISSETSGLGKGGPINVNVSGPIAISGADATNADSGIFANSNAFGAGGDAGSIILAATNLQLSGGAAISSSTFSTGQGGGVAVSIAGPAVFTGADAAGNGSGLFADTLSVGPGGNGGSIILSAASLQLTNGAKLSSSTGDPGTGGSVVVKINGAAILSGNAGVLTQSAPNGIGGDAGSVTFNAGSLQMLGGSSISSATGGTGKGGSITIDVPGDVFLNGNSFISAQSVASGAGGDGGLIMLNAGSLMLLGASDVSTSTFGLGRSGKVSVDVSGPAIVAGNSNIAAASNSTGTGGDAGSVSVTAASLQVAGGSISSSSAGTGQAGSVGIAASRNVAVTGGGSISATATAAAGGDVTISADSFTLADRTSTIATQAPSGGTINIQALNGNLSITAGTVNAQTSQGTGGNITLSANRSSLFINRGATISAVAHEDGNITLNGKDVVFIRDSTITAQANLAGGAKISIDPQYVILDHSTINGTITGAGPQLDVKVQVAADAIFLQSADSRILSNNVALPPQIDLAGSLAPLQSAFGSELQSLPDICGMRTPGIGSSFLITGNGGVEPAPDAWQPDATDEYLPEPASVLRLKLSSGRKR